MSLEHILLGMLRTPASGYDLKTEFDQGARHFWSAELSQIYPTLQQMEQRGWLKSHRERSPKGPARRVYRRTARGTRELLSWLQAGPVMGTERFAYIGQLIALGEAGDLEVTLRFVTRLRICLAEFHKLLSSAQAELRRSHPRFPEDLDDHEFHGLLCLRIGVRSLRAKVAACDENIRLIQARLAQEVVHV